MKTLIRLFKICLAFSVLTITAQTFASPIPGAGSSLLIAPHLGLFRSPLGFQISAGESGWKHSEPPADNRFIATLYEAPGQEKMNTRQIATASALSADPGTELTAAPENASLSVRVDALEHEMSIERYVQRWMKEYPRYGFDVLGSRPFAQNKQKGYVLDLVNRDSGKQLRQVVFLKKQNAVILTCRDQAASFKESLKGCNQIIRTFVW